MGRGEQHDGGAADAEGVGVEPVVVREVEAIEARAERLALAREHEHWTRDGRVARAGTLPTFGPVEWIKCADDHRTPAEQRAAALDAAAVLWAWFRGEPIMNRKVLLALLYDAIQRTEGPQSTEQDACKNPLCGHAEHSHFGVHGQCLRESNNPASRTEWCRCLVFQRTEGAAVTSDAEPLSDAWFDDLDRMHKQSGEYGWHGQGVEGAEEAWAEAIDEAYPTIRARVRELEAEVHTLGISKGAANIRTMEAQARVMELEPECDDLRRQVEHWQAVQKAEFEARERLRRLGWDCQMPEHENLRRQVEAAWTALVAIQREYAGQKAADIAMNALAALAPQTGEAGS